MLDKTLTWVEYVIVSVTFFFITILTFVNVVARFTGASISFTEELVINLAVLMTMVGAAAATRLGTHPSFSLLRDVTSGALHKVVILVVCLAMLAFYALFLWLGWNMSMSQFDSGRLTPALHIPQGLLSLALPIGSLLGVIRTIQVCAIELRGGAAFKSEEEEALESVIVIEPETQKTQDEAAPAADAEAKAGDRS